MDLNALVLNAFEVAVQTAGKDLVNLAKAERGTHAAG